MIKFGITDWPGRPEVKGGARDVVGRSRRYAAVVGRQPARGGDLELAIVYDWPTGGEVRMRARPVRRRPGTRVAGGDGDAQSRRWLQPVADRQLKAERGARPARQDMRQRDLAGRALGISNKLATGYLGG